jgi:polysaccharide export outer membrane protein
MAIKFKSRLLPVAFIVGITMSMTACTSSRKLNYFNNLPDSTVVHLPPAVLEERLVGKGDVLDIVFYAREQEAVNPFNKQASFSLGSGTSGARPVTAAAPQQGYTVDPEGLIELPVLGKIKVTGMTSSQLKNQLTTLAAPYLKEPMVDIRFNSFTVTVLGEVRGPGTYNLYAQKTTLFEALAAAGDLPHSAKKYNVHLYRDYNGERSVTKIDLTNKSLLYNQQVFQMKPNDVVYVQTRKGSIFKEDFGVWASVVSLVVSVITLGFAISK